MPPPLLPRNLWHWSWAGGAYVLLPTSGTNPSGIPVGGYPERIIAPSWTGRARAENEGGGNIDWRGLDGDTLTWWGAAGRYWHQTLTVSSSTGLAAGTVYNFTPGATPRVMYGRVGASVPAFRGGLWHNGRAVQYDGEDLVTELSATVLGACLTRFAADWYLHYVTINPGSPIHRLWQAPFNRDTHTVTAAPVELDTEIFVADRNTIRRPFLFNASGTQGYAVRRQEDDPINDPNVYQYRLWGVEINGVGDAQFVQGDYSSVQTRIVDWEDVFDYDDPDNLPALYQMSSVDRVVNELIAVDWDGDNRIDIRLTGEKRLFEEYTGTKYYDDDGYSIFGPYDSIDSADIYLEWTGPHAGSMKVTEYRRNRHHEYVPALSADGKFAGNDGVNDPRAPGAETVTITRANKFTNLYYMDARYGILLYLSGDDGTYIENATVIPPVSEEFVDVSFDGYSYTPIYSRMLQFFDQSKKLEEWTDTTVSEHARIEDGYQWGGFLTAVGFRGTFYDYDRTELPNSGHYQGTIAAHPSHVIVSHPLRAGTVHNVLYSSNGIIILNAEQLRTITSIDDDNAGYAPVRVFTAKSES